ncbi:hypothetical protein GBAR_LOCUS31036 [Geodia barretti]|uniref:Uncharacterized protein n=1 Tax=Geodia barretti TaxID=519541 RepID=A0AA35U1H9_GEOBA|nr:hypothetical protein GBAR_LOCUS31036 [Geodia barretti]
MLSPMFTPGSGSLAASFLLRLSRRSSFPFLQRGLLWSAPTPGLGTFFSFFLVSTSDSFFCSSLTVSITVCGSSVESFTSFSLPFVPSAVPSVSLVSSLSPPPAPFVFLSSSTVGAFSPSTPFVFSSPFIVGGESLSLSPPAPFVFISSIIVGASSPPTSFVFPSSFIMGESFSSFSEASRGLAMLARCDSFPSTRNARILLATFRWERVGLNRSASQRIA